MAEKPRALIVDDNAVNRQLAALFLERLGWRSRAEESGEAALKTLCEEAYDLVLLDLRMPGLDGEEVCRRIRGELRLSHLRVVAYTAHALPHEHPSLQAAGFDQVMVKPITLKDMIQVCEQVDARVAGEVQT